MAGLLIVIPLGLTIFILKFLFNLADGFLGPLIARVLRIFYVNSEYIPGLGVIAGLLVIYFTGVLAANFFGRRLLALSEDLLCRIPLVKSIYSSSKQVTKVFSSSDHDERRAVFVEFPTSGSYAIGFQTNSLSSSDQERFLSVFVPTAPNPTSGFILYVEAAKVFPAPFGVEEAMKIIVSGGVVPPAMINVSRTQPYTAKQA
ncbi:MAG: DUF502 domain-containing protein [Desulfuromonadales bacterium]|nr:DUF502 domain-containing protein [Desulfuromonadales bacterium]